MDFLLEHYLTIIAAIVAILEAFKLSGVLPFANFAKESIDVYAKYDEFKAGGWTDEEDRQFGKEVREAIDAGKNDFGNNKIKKAVQKAKAKK